MRTISVHTEKGKTMLFANIDEIIDGTEKPQTNADRIRAMSDEELARELADIWDCHNCSEYDRLDGRPLLKDEHCDQECEKHCLEWLKQPAERRCE